MKRRTDATTPGLFDPPPPAAAPEADAAPAPVPAAPVSEDGPPPPPLYSVGDLTREIGARLSKLGRVRVEGELSGFKRAASGHLYFDLKDEGARMSCVVWRSQAARALRFAPDEGMQVLAHGKLDVYAPRGAYSLIVERLEPLGLGELLARLEALKVELAARGWFERRRPLPRLPRCIGLVTSRGGAALRDFLRTRSLRWAGYPVRFTHASVQGAVAAGELAEALDRLDRSGVDAIALVRGGGSLEDLWAFNERAVAEAVWRCSVPVVSGVGHETDTTLADLVADHRAHTPTDAAQLLIPERAALEGELERAWHHLLQAMDARLTGRADRLSALARRPVLRAPDWILGERGRALDAARRGLRHASLAVHAGYRARLQEQHRRLEGASPRRLVERWGRRTSAAARSLPLSARGALVRAQDRLALFARTLEGVSPLAVLGRGYSVTRRRGATEALTDADGVQAGEELETRLARGSLVSRVLESRRAEDSGEDPGSRG